MDSALKIGGKNSVCAMENCTACGACISVCPQKILHFAEDEWGTLYPRAESEKCTGCGLCKKVCHNNVTQKFSRATEVFAAYSTDGEIYPRSTSGGIASELYRFAISGGWFVMAAKFSRTEGVRFCEVKNQQDLEWASGSKYVHSRTDEIFHEYFSHLKNGTECIFVGLPCQCAALKTFVQAKDESLIQKLFLVSLICHGVPSWKFLDAHLSFIEKKSGRKISKVLFREKIAGVLKCFSGGEEIWCRTSEQNEKYIRGFLTNLLLRENCLRCIYAKPERISDLTLGDYWGLGTSAPYTGEVNAVSCVLVQTEKGRELLEKISGKIRTEKRPPEEPFLCQWNLNRPSEVKISSRKKFRKIWQRTKNFEKAAGRVLFAQIFIAPKWFRFKMFVKRNFKIVYIVYKKLKRFSKKNQGEIK